MSKYYSKNVKINFDNLPRRGTDKGRINWEDSVGYIVVAECEDVIYNIEITKYDKGYLNVKVNNKEIEKPIWCGDFKSGKIGVLIGKMTYKYKYNIGEIIKDEKRDLVILKQIRMKDGNYSTRGYKYHCNKCGYNEGEISESHLKEGKGCPICSNRKVILGFNTIWDTDRWVVDKGLISKEDAKKYTRSSGRRISVICPNCGEIKMNVRIADIIRHKSIGCKKCGDGVSFPEKVASLVFDKLNIYYEKQKTFIWSQNKVYDFYIPSLKKLIETHGGQHYRSSKWSKCGGRTLAEEQENDRLKEELSSKNGLEYIPIDCRESDIDFIKENMIKMLGDDIDFSIINWEEIDKKAQGSLVWEVCEYWKNKKDEETTTNLVEYFSLDRSTIIEYLKKGTKYGWCFYDGKKELIKNGRKHGVNNSKKVAVYKDGDLKGIYTSVRELDRKSEQDFGIKFKSQSISRVCQGERKTYKGYTFKYLE